MFGQNKTGFSGFGTSSSSTGFGTGTAFGAPSTGGTGLFGGGASGSSTPSTGSLFGQPANTGFGQQQNTSAFSFGGTPSTSGSLFGSTNPAGTGGSLFSTPASGSGFGAKPGGFTGFGTGTTQPTTGSSLFGGTATGTSSLFGQTGGAGAFGGANVAAAGGTTVAFNPIAGQDTMMKSGVTTNINTRHQCITAMKEYENKCLEELRMEDYAANRKSKQAGTATTGSLFGQTPATQASAGGFSFGAGGGLGAGLQSGTTGFGGFGSASSAATTPFNQNRPLFGTATTTQSSFGLKLATGTQSGNMFGNTNRPLFGSTATTQPSLTGGASFFGNPGAGATSGIGFGTNTQPGGLFGAKPNTFGTATTASIGFGTGGNLFAKPASTASTFGFGTNTSSSSFGATPGGGLFNMKPGGFGAANTGLGSGGFGFGSGLGTGSTANTFGTNAAKPGGFGGFNFGNAGAGTSGFGGGLGTGTTSLSGLGGGGLTLGTNTVSSQSGGGQVQPHLLQMAMFPYGNDPLYWNLSQQNKEHRDNALKPTNPNAQKTALNAANQYKVSPRPTAKIKPQSLQNRITNGKADLFEGLEEDCSFGDTTFVPRKSVKKLVLRKKGNANQSASDSISYCSDGAGGPLNIIQDTVASSPITSRPITAPLQENNQNETDVLPEKLQRTKDQMAKRLFTDSLDENDSLLNSPHCHNNQLGKERLAADTSTFLPSSDLDNSVLGADNPIPHPTGVALTRPGYYCIPSLDEMTSMMDENGNCFVEDLTIGRDGYGNLFFPGITNVAGMNIDEIVHFRRKEVVVYPDDDKKPPLGSGLNKKAQITLDCVWPMDKTSRSPIRSPERLKLMSYEEKIEDTTARIGGKFIDYRPETGSWVFQVSHFSKYGILEDSDEEEMPDPQNVLQGGLQYKNVLMAQKSKILQQLKQQQRLKGLKDGQSLLQEDKGAMGDGRAAFMLGGEELELEEAVEDEEEKALSVMQVGDMEMDIGKQMQDDDDADSNLDSKCLASSMGVSARHIQGMKASFFADDDRDMDMEVNSKKKEDFLSRVWKRDDRMSSKLFGSLKHPGSLSLPQSPAFSDKELIDKEDYGDSYFVKPGLFEPQLSKDSFRPVPQTFRHPPVVEHKLIPSGMRPEDVPPKVAGSLVRQSIPHIKDSLLYKSQDILIDTACFIGKSFRVSWGPGMTLVHSGYPIGIPEERDTNELCLLPTTFGRVRSLPRYRSQNVYFEQVHWSAQLDMKDVQVLQQQEELLEIQLENSLSSKEEGCPLFVPQYGVSALHKLAHTVVHAADDMRHHPDCAVQKQMQTVLTLCEALWGNLPASEELEKEETYREVQLRREALSKWLSKVSAESVAEEMEASATISSEGCLKAVFSKLSVREISEACMIAQHGRDHFLALLMAQGPGTSFTRQMVTLQLETWADYDACSFISYLRLKVYCLLAGQMVWSKKDLEVNTCENLDWKRALALHLWYKCQPNSSVQQGLHQYQQGFQGTNKFNAYCKPPLPPYLKSEELQSGETIYDTAYHLLCLYADGSYGLDALLSTTSYTTSHLDYRLSWHLLQILQALEYKHLSPHNEETIHVRFASQLESMGLWHWAAFVLLHIRDGFQRRKVVCDLLQRHLEVGETFTEREEFLVYKLHIPAAWLHQAKAVRAICEGDHHAEARHWLLAKEWNKAHLAVMIHISPDAIISDDHEYLLSFLDKMSPPEHSFAIYNWSNAGKVFQDFIKIKQCLQEMKKKQPSTYDLEELQPEVMSLCTRVKSLHCSTAKDYLCQAEMSKTTSSLLRMFLMLQGQTPHSQLSAQILDLPMPEDYTLQELQALSHTLLGVS